MHLLPISAFKCWYLLPFIHRCSILKSCEFFLQFTLICMLFYSTRLLKGQDHNIQTLSTADSDNNLVHLLSISAFKLLLHVSSAFYSKLIDIKRMLYTPIYVVPCFCCNTRWVPCMKRAQIHQLVLWSSNFRVRVLYSFLIGQFSQSP